jgi:hypothetical protein
MLTRRGMLHHIGAAGAAAATLHCREAESAERSAVTFDVPRGACDSHVHIFGDAAVFPFAAGRAYTPPGASIDELLALHRALHMERVVVVHPSPYGTDNSCSVDAVRRLGARARCIAVIDRSTPRTGIEEMAGIGFRGIRLNLESGGGRFDPNAAKAALDAAAEQIKGLGWHVQFYTRLAVIEALHDHLAQLPFPVVFDHFGRADAALGPRQPGIDAMLAQAGLCLHQDFRRLPDLAEGSRFRRRDADRAIASAHQSRSHRVGQRLAASQRRSRGRAAGDRRRAAVPDRRRPGAEPIGEMGARRRDPQEDPGR